MRSDWIAIPVFLAISVNQSVPAAPPAPGVSSPEPLPMAVLSGHVPMTEEGGSIDLRAPFDSQASWTHGYIQEIPASGGASAFRPYNYKHVLMQSEMATSWGMPATAPYSQQFWRRYQDQVSAKTTVVQSPAKTDLAPVLTESQSELLIFPNPAQSNATAISGPATPDLTDRQETGRNAAWNQRGRTHRRSILPVASFEASDPAPHPATGVSSASAVPLPADAIEQWPQLGPRPNDPAVSNAPADPAIRAAIDPFAPQLAIRPRTP